MALPDSEQAIDGPNPGGKRLGDNFAGHRLGRLVVYRLVTIGLDGSLSVNWLSHPINDAAQQLPPHRNSQSLGTERNPAAYGHTHSSVQGHQEHFAVTKTHHLSLERLTALYIDGTEIPHGSVRTGCFHHQTHHLGHPAIDTVGLQHIQIIEPAGQFGSKIIG
ncbi:hypothetical protein ES703_117134 [subsurface metagenome]